MRGTNRFFRTVALVVLLTSGSAAVARAATILDFTDVPSGTLAVFNPYSSQGFQLTATSGGFVFNSPDTGNGSPQPAGNNPFYAGANGFAAFAPAMITLAAVDGSDFSLLSIALSRNFAFDPAPSVTFTGTLSAGGTVTQTFDVTSSSPPLAFQTFSFTGFSGLSSVSWGQGGAEGSIHQFGSIEVDTDSDEVPEPSSLMLLTLGVPWARRALRARRAR